MKRRSFIKGSAIPFLATAPWPKVPSKKVYKHYVGFFMYGAPARWAYDLPLALHADEQQARLPNHLIITDRDQKGDWRYSTVDYKKFQMPYFWGQNVPSTSGSQPAMDLLSNMHIVRGVDVQFSNHPIAAKVLISRALSGTSYTGLMADASPYLFTNLALGDNPIARSFVSPLGQEAIILNESPEELMEYLLAPFKRGQMDYENDDELKSLFSLFGIVYSQQLSNKKISQIIAHYKDALERYKLLAQKAINATYPGLNDRPIESKQFTSVMGEKDIRDVAIDFWVRDSYFVGSDLRESMKNAQIQKWPSYFAFAETVIKYELSNNVSLGPPVECGNTFVNLSLNCPSDVKAIKSQFKNGKTEFVYEEKSPYIEDELQLDTHKHGRVLVTYTNALFYAAMTSCFLEFVGQLKKFKHSQGLTAFDQTLIHLTAEFGRDPSDTKAESDHDNRSHVSTFISGMIPEFHVTGDLIQQSHHSKATHGQGVHNDLKSGHIISTVSSFMGVRSLSPSAESLVVADNNSFKPKRPMGKIIYEKPAERTMNSEGDKNEI